MTTVAWVMQITTTWREFIFQTVVDKISTLQYVAIYIYIYIPALFLGQ